MLYISIYLYSHCLEVFKTGSDNPCDQMQCQQYSPSCENQVWHLQRSSNKPVTSFAFHDVRHGLVLTFCDLTKECVPWLKSLDLNAHSSALQNQTYTLNFNCHITTQSLICVTELYGLSAHISSYLETTEFREGNQFELNICMGCSAESGTCSPFPDNET